MFAPETLPGAATRESTEGTSSAGFSWFAVAEAALAFVGAGIAGTLWWAHRRHVDLPCSSGSDCDLVAQSRWGHVALGAWSFDVALLGLLAYVVLLSLAMAKMACENPHTARRLHGLLWAGSACGAAYSLYLQYVAHVRLGAFCPWCFASACVMTLLLLTTTADTLSQRKRRS